MVTLRSRWRLRSLLEGCSLFAALLSTADVLADPPPTQGSAVAKAPADKAAPSPPAPRKPSDPVMQKAPDDRRSGLAINLSFGNGIASVVGYPNDPKKVGYASYYAESGVRPGSTFSLWVGGAITDWFNFGVGFMGGGLMFTGDTTVSAGGLIFHAETYPLFFKGGAWRDVGLMIDAGTGSATIIDDKTKEKLVDGGSGSILGAGIFYEAAKLWRVRIAPFIYTNYVWSGTVRRPGVFLGAHSTFYWKL